MLFVHTHITLYKKKNCPHCRFAHKTFSRFNTLYNPPHMLIALVCTLLPNEISKKNSFVWGIQLNSRRIKVKQVNDEKTF